MFRAGRSDQDNACDPQQASHEPHGGLAFPGLEATVLARSSMPHQADYPPAKWRSPGTSDGCIDEARQPSQIDGIEAIPDTLSRPLLFTRRAIAGRVIMTVLCLVLMRLPGVETIICEGTGIGQAEHRWFAHSFTCP